MNIGEKIKDLRVRKGYTQENMADMLEMSVTNYAYIEQGRVNPNIPKLEQIAEKLETNLFELLSLNEKNVYYIHSETNNGLNGLNTSASYIVNDKLPENYQLLAQENAFLKKENEFLRSEIENLKEINALLKGTKG